MRFRKTDRMVPHLTVDFTVFHIDHMRIVEHLLRDLKADAMNSQITFRFVFSPGEPYVQLTPA
jgi:hypothetical protein